MVMVEAGKEIKLENLLSLRKQMTQEEINTEMMKVGKFLKDNEVKKNGPIVTVTFTVDNKNGQPVLDMEILVPIDKEVKLPDEYCLKPVFHIVNAVYARHEGNPDLLQGTYDDMLRYIQQNGLQQITAGYNVQVKDLMPGMTQEEMIIDVYIGINPNIL